jgi:hypothetical protein
MILIHRITPFVLGLIVALGFLFSYFWPSYILAFIAITTVLSAVLIGRLVNWGVKSFQFWNFIGTSILFISSSMGLFMFFENSLEKIGLALVSSLAVFLYAEHVFTYRHTPAAYKTYSLEHLSLVLHIMIVFFLSAIGYGLIMFLQVSLWILGPLLFLLGLFVIYGMFWVSKVEHQRALIYAFAGATLLLELFIAMAYLPTGFYTNAAVIALAVYLFLGLSRAHVLEKLTKSILIRYVALGSAMFLAVLGTAQWI